MELLEKNLCSIKARNERKQVHSLNLSSLLQLTLET